MWGYWEIQNDRCDKCHFFIKFPFIFSLRKLYILFKKTKYTGYHIYNNHQCIPAGLHFRGGCIFFTPTGSISYRETLLMVGRCL